MNKNTLFIRMIMRTTILLYSTTIVFSQLLFAEPSEGQILNKTINVTLKGANLYDAIQQLQHESEVEFAFDERVLQLENIGVQPTEFDHTPLRDVIEHLLRGTPIDYETKGRNTVLLLARQQPGYIKGRIANGQGQPLEGASVKIVELDRSASTDREGTYSFPVRSGTYEVIASFISFGTQRRSVTVQEGQTVSVDFMLNEAFAEMSEVVVTALGIRREERSLGYATTSLNDEAVTDARTGNWVNALSGKVAGLTVRGTGAGPISSSRITLRGENSLNLDNNQALIVVDGVPVSTKITSTGFSSHLSADNAIDYGSNASDINPEDIENINVLKGPAATALYGSRAAAGAIIITTKSGKGEKGLGISYNLTTSLDQINRWPDYQYEYGEGRVMDYYSYGDSSDGPNTSKTAGGGRSWGPKYAGQLYYQYNPDSPDGTPTERTPWVPYKNSRTGYFRSGNNISNNVAIQGGNERGNARVSLTHFKNNWIVPNTGFERINAALSASQRIADKLTISGSVNYTNRSSDNIPVAGYNNHTLMYFLIIGTTTNVKPEWHQKYWEDGLDNVQQRRPFYTGPDNPYLAMYEMLNKINKHGAFGNISANYKFSDRIDLTVKSGLDMSYEKRSQQRPFSMTRNPRGMFRTQDLFLYEINTDALLAYRSGNKGNWRYGLSVGGNIMNQSYDFNGVYADQLNQPGVYQISNSLDPAVADPQRYLKAINSIYGLGQVSYREMVFVDLTGRNDWSSTLPYDNNSFFYPSVNSSFILSELFNLKSIDYLKLRLSWAQVGNDTRPYQIQKYYDSIYGNGFTNPTTLFNDRLKPEITTSYEVGAEVKLWKSRMEADVTVYNNNSKNQIIAVPIDPTAGYSSQLVNAGLINSKGAEVSWTIRPLMNTALKWETTLTWATNRSYVRELAPGVDNQIIYAHASNVTIEARVGGRMGDLYGKGFERSPDGQVVYTSDGIPAPLDPVTRKWGNVFPDWRAGLSNTFGYKRMKLSVLLDGQKGGKMYSQTNHKNNEFGNTKVTLPGRDAGIVGQGVVRQPDGSYVPNTTRVEARPYYERYYAISNAETNIFDASFLKIREVRLDYVLPESVVSRLKLKNVNVALYGRDLFNFTNFPAFDPEGGNLNNGALTPGVELAQYPSTRNIGINLTCNF